MTKNRHFRPENVVFGLSTTSISLYIHFEAHLLYVLTIRKYIGSIVVGKILPAVVFMAINEVENHEKSSFWALKCGFSHLHTPIPIGIHFEAHLISVLTIMNYIGTLLVGRIPPVVVFMAINEVENHEQSSF